MELEVWFPGIRLWAPTQSAAGNWDLSAQGAGKLLIFECKGCSPLRFGHTVPINMPQLQRYATGPEFARVRLHVFYVLPAPPWPGEAPSPAPPFTSLAALPATYADQRLAGPAGGCWEWFHVISATALWGSLMGSGIASVSTRRLPNPATLGLPPHHLGPLPGVARLADFLEDVARCRRVPLAGAKHRGGGRPSAGEPWTRPRGREPVDGLSPSRFQEPPLPPHANLDTVFEGKPPEGSAPTPLAAFIPNAALAVE